MGRLRGKGGGVAAETRGEEYRDEAGEMEGEDGPGEGWSVGAADVEAEGPYAWFGASSTSFNSDDRKLGPLSPPGRTLELAALDDSPF